MSRSMTDHHQRFNAIVAEVARLTGGRPDNLADGIHLEQGHLIIEGPRNIKIEKGWGDHRKPGGWVAHLNITTQGLLLSAWIPEVGPISDSGGLISDDDDPIVTARTMLKLAGITVSEDAQ